MQNNQEDFSENYPLGNMLETVDIEREKELLNQIEKNDNKRT